MPNDKPVTTKEDELRKALNFAVEVLRIASDWHAPTHYDLPVPDGYEDTLDADSHEPMWPALYLIIGKLEKITND